MGIPFLDNFPVFWRRSNLFAWDGLHLKKEGKQLLAYNIELTLKSCQKTDIHVM